MAIPFEFVIAGPPVSQQIRNRRRPSRREEWMQTVRTAAERRWDGEPPFMGEVAVTITYVSSRARVDVDNIPKPILDALKGFVYADDRQVADLMCRRKSLDPNLRILAGSVRVEPLTDRCASVHWSRCAQLQACICTNAPELTLSAEEPTISKSATINRSRGCPNQQGASTGARGGTVSEAFPTMWRRPPY